MTSDGLSRGRVEQKVRADIEALLTTHPMGEALAEVAFYLARLMDEGVTDPRVSKELRETLSELASQRGDDDDDLGSLLSAPLRDDTDS